MADIWPDFALASRAAEMGNAVLDLLAQETRWIHRRLERIEIVSATQFTRTVAADLTVPLALSGRLELRADPATEGTGDKRRVVIPLGSLPKGALVDFTLAPADANRLTAAQTNVLLLSALAPYAREAHAPDGFLSLAQRIILSETEARTDLAAAKALLDKAVGGSDDARDFLRKALTEFSASYALLVALDVVPGLPLRITYGHRDYYPQSEGAVGAAPLVIDAPLVHASERGPAYRLELVAPEGLEIDTASLARVEGERRYAVEAVNPDRGAGAFVQLRGPDSAKRPQQTRSWPSSDGCVAASTISRRSQASSRRALC
jgi:hypothetical protein